MVHFANLKIYHTTYVIVITIVTITNISNSLYIRCDVYVVKDGSICPVLVLWLFVSGHAVAVMSSSKYLPFWTHPH